MDTPFTLTPELEKLRAIALNRIHSLPKTASSRFGLEKLQDGTGLVVPCMWGRLNSETFSHGAQIIWDRIPEGGWLTKEVDYNVAYAPFVRGLPVIAPEVAGMNPVEGWMIVYPTNDPDEED